MAFADPQSVTVGGAAKSLAKTSIIDGNWAGVYLADDMAYRLDIAQAKTKRSRHVVKLTARKVAADPLAADRNLEYAMSVTLTVDAPLVGYTNSEQKDLVVALADWLKASTNANTVKLVNFEA